MNIIVDNTINDCFVHPDLCKKLVDAGLSGKVFYHWRVRGGQAALFTHEFDMDDYYVDGLRHQDAINPPDLILPAFSLVDVEIWIPAGYTLTLDHLGNYEIWAGYVPPGDRISSKRMTDVFAKLLLQSINKHIVDPNKINSIMSR